MQHYAFAYFFSQVTVHICFVVIVACTHCFLQSYQCCKCTHTLAHIYVARLVVLAFGRTTTNTYACLCNKHAFTHTYYMYKHCICRRICIRANYWLCIVVPLYFLIFFAIALSLLLYAKWCTLHCSVCSALPRFATTCTIEKNSHNYRFFSIPIFSSLSHFTSSTLHTFDIALCWLLGVLVQRWWPAWWSSFIKVKC